MRAISFVLLSFAMPVVSTAGPMYSIQVNTSALPNSGTFYLDFQFFDGTGLPGDLNNNSATLSNFSFGGGSALSGGIALGGASGSLSSGVLLHDTVFFNDYSEGFTPGALLNFDLAISNLFNPSGAPDLFTMAILDDQGFEIPTTGFANEFVAFSLEGGAAPVISTAVSAPGAAFSIGAPVVEPLGGNPVPEPSSAVLLLSAAALGTGTRRILHRRRSD